MIEKDFVTEGLRRTRIDEYLEKELYRDVWADVIYKDGTQKRIKMLDVLSLYTNGGTPPQIADVSFIGNTSNQGILPDLVKYLIETSR